MPVTDATVAKFWAKFKKIAAELKAIPMEGLGKSSLYQELHDQLAKCHSRVKLECAGSSKADGDRTLIISADSEEKLFPFVQTIIAAAPVVPGWKTQAFRSRDKVEGVRLEFGPHALVPEDIFAKVEPGSPRVTITLYVRGLNQENHQPMAFGAYLLLQHTIGEYDVVKSVELGETQTLPDPVPSGLVPLIELPSRLDQLLGRV